MEVRYPGAEMSAVQMVVPPVQPDEGGCFRFSQEKKKKLRRDQLDSLENGFQEEKKLDPERKMKLAGELGLQPRQVAIWFQNRRARWKVKQLERQYDALKLEFDVVSREKQKLQEEVMRLKAIVMNEATKKQVPTGHPEASSDESVVATSAAAMYTSSKGQGTSKQNHHHHHSKVDEYNYPLSSPYWAALPSYP
ncbi:hypothetical protein Nepgr_027563 [Nepenthes gracilis]|uniref:Homeobox-leucine zipper protein n=1 Tax=Nepenthes gracilis TaxID=150966 RepID=A0AAD3TA25_NEPGR|nr:hypothetical protein Nepgr_027563 [Nepenthes gracilis]